MKHLVPFLVAAFVFAAITLIGNRLGHDQTIGGAIAGAGLAFWRAWRWRS